MKPQKRNDDEGVIRADELYTLERLRSQLKLTESSWRSLRDSGLPFVEKGKRKFIVGRHAIAWFAGDWPDSSAERRAA